jgi:hypothetical protein
MKKLIPILLFVAYFSSQALAVDFSHPAIWKTYQVVTDKSFMDENCYENFLDRFEHEMEIEDIDSMSFSISQDSPRYIAITLSKGILGGFIQYDREILLFEVDQKFTSQISNTKAMISSAFCTHNGLQQVRQLKNHHGLHFEQLKSKTYQFSIIGGLRYVKLEDGNWSGHSPELEKILWDRYRSLGIQGKFSKLMLFQTKKHPNVVFVQFINQKESKINSKYESRVIIHGINSAGLECAETDGIFPQLVKENTSHVQVLDKEYAIQRESKSNIQFKYINPKT